MTQNTRISTYPEALNITFWLARLDSDAFCCARACDCFARVQEYVCVYSNRRHYQPNVDHARYLVGYRHRRRPLTRRC